MLTQHVSGQPQEFVAFLPLLMLQLYAALFVVPPRLRLSPVTFLGFFLMLKMDVLSALLLATLMVLKRGRVTFYQISHEIYSEI